MFLGLCTLADWVGSDERFFPRYDRPDTDYFDRACSQATEAMATIGLDISRQTIRADPRPSFSELFGINHPPNAIQCKLRNLPLDHRVAIVESETGSGKTEAALWRFARMREEGIVDGLYFALPTRAAATQIHSRVSKFVQTFFRRT